MSPRPPRTALRRAAAGALLLALLPPAAAQEVHTERPQVLPADFHGANVLAGLSPALVIMRPTDDPRRRFDRFVAAGTLPAGLSPRSLHTGGYRTLQPLASHALGPEISVSLALAYPLALDRVAHRGTCRDLFAALGTDGILALATTSYMPPTVDQEDRLCRRGAMAFTVVGTPVTWLCSDFARLPRQTAALALIHEALHYAGLPERPVVDAAPSPGQINRLVARRCGL